MAKIMLNGKEYGGSGLSVKEVTREEYDALSEDEKMSDIIYQITDEDNDAIIVNMALGETERTAFAGNRGKALEQKTSNLEQQLNSMIISVEGTLEAGETTLVLEHNAIVNDSVIDVYASKYGVSPSDVSAETGKVTLTFSKPQETDVDIKVVIINK